MSLLHRFGEVETEKFFLPSAEKTVQEPQPVNGVKFDTTGAEMSEMGRKVGACAGEICAGIENVLFRRRNGDVLVLYDAARSCGLVEQHPVVFLPVFVQNVVFQREQDGFFKIYAVEAAVADGDFRGGPAVERIEQLRIGEKQGFLIFFRGHRIVDVVKAVRL